MSTRCAIVLSGYRAVPPPGIDQTAYAEACLTDSYEAIAPMSQLTAGLAGDSPLLEEIGWPGDLVIGGAGRSVRSVVDCMPDDHGFTELIVLPGDVPDLPEMIVAKIARALSRAAVALAPQLGGTGLAALGVRLPLPDWLAGDLDDDLGDDLDLDSDPYDRLQQLAPRRNLVVRTPGWHRMDRPESVHRLDPGLEGWDNVRLLLSRSRTGG
ncbi:hypothetical protein [Microlunatus sp. Gsoil 973]|jgi:hypothetical protein|uniref:hypothetical protein n=1 Tax=Microlunatus sp. Gsoil 973 TaxID=2672569 RepID=UPI0012B50336|nr:hypothetical protein [Microlunatus sp. Gsoil 973]QGN32206.1 hypothetical protein GJV80_04690 [Microlunatus sp. Gsoil 973]